MNVENLFAYLEGNTILLKSADGEEKYTISAPKMTDSSEAVSYDIQITLEEIAENKYKITLLPDKEWLLDIESLAVNRQFNNSGNLILLGRRKLV